jgi:aldehyde dehydrogenase (NAD+)
MDNLDFCLKNVKGWYRQHVDTPMMLGPGDSYVIHEPFGVCLILGAWNFPMGTIISPLINAVAAGNATISKPSELAPNSSRVVAQIIRDGLDENLHKVVEGTGAMAAALLEQRYDLIMFTGSP